MLTFPLCVLFDHGSKCRASSLKDWKQFAKEGRKRDRVIDPSASKHSSGVNASTGSEVPVEADAEIKPWE
jgi:hypothetical protein